MSDFNDFPAIAFALFALPGFISILVFRLLHPVARSRFQDLILEAVAFGAINFALMSWAIPVAGWLFAGFQEPQWARLYLLAVVVVFVAPAIWPVLLLQFMRFAENRGWILRSVNSAWDQFFLQKESCWVIVHLHNGKRIGGFFGRDSYASLYPEPGSIYIQQIWNLDDDGKFLEAVPDSKGMIFRPADYHLIEFKEADDTP